MGLVTRFYLDALEIDEPENWDSFQIEISRDNNFHGIGFESSVSSLLFYGAAMRYIDEAKLILGLKANVIFKADQTCSDSDTFENILTGKLNFAKYKKFCGDVCYVSLPVETSSCETAMTNRFNQNVDVDKLISQNGINGLAAYPQLGTITTIPAKELDYVSEGFVKDDEPLTSNNTVFAYRPNYTDLRSFNFNQTELTDAGSYFDIGGANGLSPQILWDERLANFPNPIIANGRMKGTVDIPVGFTPVGDSEIRIYFARGEFSGGAVLGGAYMENHLIATFFDGVGYGPQSIPFDITFAPFTWLPIDDGTNGLYQYMAAGSDNIPTTIITFDDETFFKLETTKEVPATTSKLYMINEVLSRVVENITDGCMRVKSEYYGRTDSLPFSFPDDGCGGLRSLTSGLKLRNAPAPQDTFFVSLEDLIKGLQAIDNIGIGVEPDITIPTNFVLRIEALDFFYQDVEIFECLSINQSTIEVEEERDFSIIQIGYKKWQTLANFGLDEFNSDREYHLGIETLNNKIDLRSVLVAGGYAIEITREQTLVATNSADTTYDDETFILCMKRLTYNTFEIEQGGIDNPVNIFSPLTAVNYRISPLRNLMRWYRSLVSAYANISSSLNKLFFSAGTGNINASGQLAEGYGYGSSFCKDEGIDISEKMDLFTTAFNGSAKFLPLWSNEMITFDYPMSIKDYNQIKLNRYGYISYQCGNGPISKGWIKGIKYTPAAGIATFILRQKWTV